MKKRLILIVLCLGFSTVAQASEVECTGYNSVDGGLVQGYCNDGFFTGYESTGAVVQGNCVAGEMFMAYDTQTGAMVSGSCSAQP
jgi:hypothetical protein